MLQELLCDVAFLGTFLFCWILKNVGGLSILRLAGLLFVHSFLPHQITTEDLIAIADSKMHESYFWCQWRRYVRPFSLLLFLTKFDWVYWKPQDAESSLSRCWLLDNELLICGNLTEPPLQFGGRWCIVWFDDDATWQLLIDVTISQRADSFGCAADSIDLLW